MEPINPTENQPNIQSPNQQPNISAQKDVQQNNLKPEPPTLPNTNIKKDWTLTYDKKMATTFLIVAIVSLFIIPYMAYGSLSMSCLGIYSGIKNKFGAKQLVLNISALIISIASIFLKAFASR